jgi:ADP-ribose pyrophosphatase YjhB (NUDIX family)
MVLNTFRDPGEPQFCAKCGAGLAIQARGGRLRPSCPRCGWVYYARNAMGAAILVESNDGRVLLVQRANEPYRGWWMLPAGFVEYGDSAADTALREATEETGLIVELTGLQGVYFGTDDPRDIAHLVSYTARIVGGTLTPADDAAAADYFGPDELPPRIAFEGQRQALEDWAAERRGRSP